MKGMKNMMNEFAMLLDSYMAGYDEGKNDEVEMVRTRKRTDRRTKNISSYRRKKSFNKAKNRMMDLNARVDYPMTDAEKKIVRGMLRSHQVSEIHQAKEDNVLAASHGNQMRLDATYIRMKEQQKDAETEF